MQFRNFLSIAAVTAVTSSAALTAVENGDAAHVPTSAIGVDEQAAAKLPATSTAIATQTAIGNLIDKTVTAAAKMTASVDVSTLEAPFFDAEAAAATMKEDAAYLEETAEEELNKNDFLDFEKDVDELIETIADGSKHFIEAWSYKKLMDIHIPVPSKVLTTASRGMDAVTKTIDLMSRTAVFVMGHRACAPDVVVIPEYIVNPLKLGYKRPVQGINYIMENSVLAVKQIRLKVRPTYFHKDPWADPRKGAFGVITRAYNVLEAGQIFANISINRTGLEWMPSLIEPAMNWAREIVVSLDGDVTQYPPLPPPPEKAPEFVWPDIPSIKDTLGQVQEISDKWETKERELKELAGKLAKTRPHANPVVTAAAEVSSQQPLSSEQPLTSQLP
ncbi:hypothetical protein SEPCBS119000_004025 [Sporothrix epigloea]|uniref:Uncharacterized protein n=1 Tax=Sporothrix epigloea TaxID=1892477 RepID=A0ABP0DR57_9PEZI